MYKFKIRNTVDCCSKIEYNIFNLNEILEINYIKKFIQHPKYNKFFIKQNWVVFEFDGFVVIDGWAGSAMNGLHSSNKYTYFVLGELKYVPHSGWQEAEFAVNRQS